MTVLAKWKESLESVAQACCAFFIGISSIHSISLYIKHLTTMAFKFVWNTGRGFCIMDMTSLFTDETAFTNHGNVNVHNMQFWATETMYWLRQVQHQRQWSVNVRCGIVGHHIIGPYFIDGRLNERKYRRLLRRALPVLMEDLPLNLRQVMWYQHDGFPAHNAIVARNSLNQQFPNRWIGRGIPV